MDYFHMMLKGNLGRDPELRYTPNGNKVCKFSVAVNRVYKNREGTEMQETMWFVVSTWDNLAELCNKYLSQGSKVLVEGRLNPDSETGGPKVYKRNDGSHGASYEVTSRRVIFLDGPGKEAQEEDIPF